MSELLVYVNFNSAALPTSQKDINCQLCRILQLVLRQTNILQIYHVR